MKQRLQSLLITPLAFAFILGGHTAGIVVAQEARVARPSIVFILADDMGIGDVRCFNPEGKIATPCMDKLASEGMRLSDAHSPSAVCTPTRYGILTGRYAWRGRLKKGVLWGASPPLIEKGRPTVASFLKNAGYATACIGKWHLGLGIPRLEGGVPKGRSGEYWSLDYEKPLTNTPLDHGFDHFFGVSASLDVPPYLWIDDNRWTEIPTVNKAFHRKGPASKSFEAVDCLPKITAQAVRWIEETSKANPQEPFFLYFPLTAPHTPVIPSKGWKGRSGLGDYADFVMEVDDTIGRVSAAIEAVGRTDSTLFIVTSDNGCAPAAVKQSQKHGHEPSGGFRGQKADIYEGGHRVPFIARWPGRIVKGSRSTETVCLTDLFATTADVIGLPLPPNAAEDSVSLLPVLTGSASLSQRTREAVVHHSINGSFAIRKGNLKLNLCPGSGGWSNPRPAKAKKLKLPPLQLFDLTIDPSESRNLAVDHPAVAKELSLKLKSIVDAGQSSKLAAQGLTHAPLLGASPPGGITLWTHADLDGTWIAEARSLSSQDALHTETARASLDNNFNMTFRFRGLQMGATYEVSLRETNSSRPGWIRRYTATEAISEKRPVRILFGSCADEDAGTADTVRQMATEKADLVVLLGDTPYIDTTDLAKQRKRHLEFLGFPAMAALLSTTPFLATWDDHDFGSNDVDGLLKNKTQSRRAFIETHPNPSHGARDEGIYTSYRLGDAEVFLLDTRWFANTAPAEADPTARTLLGSAQWKWLEKGLASSRASAKIIACGMIWNGATRPGKLDHWGNWPHERDRLFRFIGENDIKGVTLIGGDIHRSRVIKHASDDRAGQDIIELITSPMHDRIIEAANAPHPGLLWDAGAIHSYLRIDIDSRQTDSPRLRARFMNRSGEELYSVEIPFTEQRR